MLVFFVLLLVPVLLQHIVIGDKRLNPEKRNHHALLFFFVFLTILVSLRHESVGTDTDNYIYFFDVLSDMDWRTVGQYPLEIGFCYFNKLVSVLFKEPQVFLAVTAIVIVVMIYPTYKRLCVDASLTIVLFCIMSTFVMMFSGLRQMLAIGIGFIAYEYTRNKKLVPFILCVLIAITFHTSAFMLAFMYPLYHVRVTKKWLLVVVPVLVIVFVFNRQIFSVLGLLLVRYTGYDTSISKTGSYTLLLLFAIFAAFAFLIPDEKHLDKETIGLRNFLLLSVTLQMFAPLHVIAMRMNYYYIIFIPLLLPKIIQYRSFRMAKVARFARHIMVVFFFAYFLITSSIVGGLDVFPYHFFWENV